MNSSSGGRISNKRQFLYNLFSSYGNTLICSVLSFISVPIALNYWGGELYGVWTILISFATYITASGLGIDSATGLLMTKNPNLDTKVGILKKGVKLLVCCGFVAAVILTLVTIFVPDWFRIIGKMDEANYPVARISACIFIAGIILNLPLSAVSNSLQAFGKAYLGTLVGTLQSILSFVVILLVVGLKLSLPFYVLLFSCNTIFCNLIKLCVVLATIKTTRAAMREDAFADNKNSCDNHYKAIFRMGINMSLYGTALMLIPNLSNLIISNNIDVKSLVPYSLSYKLFIIVVGLIQNVSVALSPLFGAEYGNGNWEWLKDAYRKMFYTLIPLSVFGLLGVIWLSKPFIKLWTGSFDNYAGSLIYILLAVYFFFVMMSHINHIIINAFNYTSKVWLISWGDGILFLLSSTLLIKCLGVVSVPLGLCLGACLVSSWAYPLLVYKRSERRFVYDFKYLAKNLAVFVCSIFAYRIVAGMGLSLVAATILEILGMLATSVVLLLLLPAEIKASIASKIWRKK